MASGVMIPTSLPIDIAKHTEAAAVTVTLSITPKGLLIRASKGQAEQAALASWEFLVGAVGIESHLRQHIDTAAEAVQRLYDKRAKAGFADHVRSRK